MSLSDGSPWYKRVEAYLDELAEIAETIDLVLDNTRVQTLAVEAGQVDQSTAELRQALARLEDKIAEREDLLRANDAPKNGLTLREKLLSNHHIDDARLAKRCQSVAQAIQQAHQRAVSLFVCQYHLADITGEIVSLLAGASALKTYDGSSTKSKASRKGGGLFDEAA